MIRDACCLYTRALYCTVSLLSVPSRVQSNDMQYSVGYSTAQHSTQHSTAQYSTAQSTAQYTTVHILLPLSAMGQSRLLRRDDVGGVRIPHDVRLHYSMRSWFTHTTRAQNLHSCCILPKSDPRAIQQRSSESHRSSNPTQLHPPRSHPLCCTKVLSRTGLPQGTHHLPYYPQLIPAWEIVIRLCQACIRGRGVFKGAADRT